MKDAEYPNPLYKEDHYTVCLQIHFGVLNVVARKQIELAMCDLR
jgi:hypothetical protein